METKVTGSSVQDKKQYCEPRLVLHGDISEITMNLFGGHKHWHKDKEHCS